MFFDVSTLSGLSWNVFIRLISSADNELPKKVKASLSLVTCESSGCGSTLLIILSGAELVLACCEQAEICKHIPERKIKNCFADIFQRFKIDNCRLGAQ